MHLPVFIIYSNSITEYKIEIIQHAISHLPQQVITNAMRFKNVSDQALRLSARFMLKWYCEQENIAYHGLAHRASGQPISPFGGAISIAYSQDRAILAMSKSELIGIDIEAYSKEMPDLTAYLSDREKQILVESREPEKKLIQLWTAKEAVSKALGKGLFLELEKLDCSEAQVASEHGNLYLRQIDLLEKYCITLAHSSPMVNIMLTEVSPI